MFQAYPVILLHNHIGHSVQKGIEMLWLLRKSEFENTQVF